MEANNIEIENIIELNQINNEENIINEENDIKSDRSKKKVYNLTYYNKHRSKILEKLKETKKCIYCESVVQLSNYSRHTKRCMKLKPICDSTSTSV
jgi:hypothetical protein